MDCKERCPSGLRCRSGTSVWGFNSTKGSNPFLSAIIRLNTNSVKSFSCFKLLSVLKFPYEKIVYKHYYFNNYLYYF